MGWTGIDYNHVKAAGGESAFLRNELAWESPEACGRCILGTYKRGPNYFFIHQVRRPDGRSSVTGIAVLTQRSGGGKSGKPRMFYFKEIEESSGPFVQPPRTFLQDISRYPPLTPDAAKWRTESLMRLMHERSSK